MKKILKSFLIVIVMALICYTYLGISNKVWAAGISVSSSSVTVGNTTTVSVSIPDGYAGYDGTISFDSSKLSYVSSSSGNLVGGIIKVADVNTSLGQVSNFSVTFKGTNAGSASISVSLNLCNSEGATTSSSGAGTITVNAQEQPQTPPETPSAPSAPSNPTAVENTSKPKEPNFTQTNETVYATKSMNVRASWSTSSSKIGGLSAGQAVTRTGVGDNGWSRISYNGKTAYVSTSLITTTKPEEKPEEPKVSEENPEETSEENTEEEQKDEENNLEDAQKAEEEIYQKIVTEIGTIPEVGTNKNIYIYLFLMLASIISIFIIYIK